MANEPLFAFNSSDTGRLRRMLRWFEAGDFLRPSDEQPTVQPRPADLIFGTLDGAASPTTALTGGLKSATMSVYTFTSTGGTSDTGTNETVWNASKMQAVTGRWTAARRVTRNGRYLIIYQSASTTGCT